MWVARVLRSVDETYYVDCVNLFYLLIYAEHFTELWPLLLSFSDMEPYRTCWSVVYNAGPGGWEKMSGDNVGELHYSYYPVQEAPAETEMGES